MWKFLEKYILLLETDEKLKTPSSAKSLPAHLVMRMPSLVAKEACSPLKPREFNEFMPPFFSHHPLSKAIGSWLQLYYINTSCRGEHLLR